MRDDVIAKAREKSDINEHLVFLYDLAVKKRPKKIIECGIRHGISAFSLRRAARTVGAHYYGIDIDKRCQIALDKDQIPGLREFFSAEHDCVWAICHLEKLWKQFVMIDTSHEENHTFAELRIFGKADTICLHDSNNERFPGVRLAIERFLGKEGVIWTEDFVILCGEWMVTHFAKNNGMTILERMIEV